MVQRAGFAHTGHTEVVYLAQVADLPRPESPIAGLSVRRSVGINGTRLSAVLGEETMGYIEVEVFEEGNDYRATEGGPTSATSTSRGNTVARRTPDNRVGDRRGAWCQRLPGLRQRHLVLADRHRGSRREHSTESGCRIPDRRIGALSHPLGSVSVRLGQLEVDLLTASPPESCRLRLRGTPYGKGLVLRDAAGSAQRHGSFPWEWEESWRGAGMSGYAVHGGGR